MPKPHQTLAQISSAVRSPRSAPSIYKDFNVLRQDYILETAARHFHMREDDPAPLYAKTLLDVGCGESTIAEFLALSGADITAVDPNAAALIKAEASAAAFGAPISFLNVKAEQLINNLQKYDIILALDVLEDVPDPAKFLWVLKQVLAPGGVVIFSVINRTPRAWFYHIFLSGYIYHRTLKGSRSFRRFHTPSHLATMCQSIGLTLGHVQGLRFSLTRQRWKKSQNPSTRYLACAVATSEVPS